MLLLPTILAPTNFALEGKHIPTELAFAAGRYLASKLDGKVDLTLIEPKAYAFHGNASVRATAQGADYARSLVAPVPTIVPNGRVVMGSVTDFTDNTATVTKLDGSTESVAFDYLVICTGSRYAAPGKLMNVRQPKAAVEYFDKLSRAVAKSKSIVVVGGGPVGIELAGELAAEHGKNIKVTLAHRGAKLFSGAWTNTSAGTIADAPAAYAKTRLEALGVEGLLNTGLVRPVTPPPVTPPSGAEAKDGDAAADVAEGKAADDGKEDAPLTGDEKGGAAAADEEGKMVDVAVEDESPFGDGVTMPTGGKVATSAGGQLDADLVFWCTGATPNTEWLRNCHPDLLDERGFVKVDQHLRVEGKNNVFCMGDCAASGDAKLAYRAMEQTDKVMLPNLQALIAAADGGKDTQQVQLKQLEVGKPAAVVSFGPDNAMADLGGFALCDCLVVRMKARDMFRKEFAQETHGTAADSTDWAAQGVPDWDLEPPAGQAK